MFNLTSPYVVNFIWFQSLWFLAILTADSPYGNLLTVTALGGYLFYVWRELSAKDLYCVALVTLAGVLLESLWIQLGFLVYAGAAHELSVAPVWIASLWAGVAVSLKYSLAWLGNRLLLAALLSFVSCPVSFYAAQRLGAVSIEISLPLFMSTVAVAWAILIPLALRFNETTKIQDDDSKGWA